MDPPRLLDGRLKLRHLVLIDALAERGTVVGAAERLHVTQPVVTRALHELEDILGVRLFERGARGITPTIFGLAFIDHARSVLAELERAGRHVAELADADRGTVTVGTHLAGSNLLLPRAIAALKRDHPLVTVVVHEATPDVLLTDLLSGRVDLIVGRLTPRPGDARVEQVALHEEPIRLVTRVGHPALDLPDPRLAELLAYPWIVPVTETVLRHELEAILLREELPLPDDRIECTSILTLRQLLLDTDVIAVLPMLIAEEDERLAMLPTLLEPLRRTVGVTLPAGRSLSPSAEALLDRLHVVAGDLARSFAA
jgi:DNA-binding transcriptional LysR family regulator